jgi:hypothetical protein
MPYTSGVPMTTDVFSSRDGTLTGFIPEGWFSSVDDTLAPALAAWLTRNDFGATITLREIHLDAATSRRVSERGMKPLLFAAAGMTAGDAVKPLAEPLEFEIRGIKFCGGEFSSDPGPTRLVVFGTRGKFYECQAAKTKGIWSADDFRKLFTVQQSVLSTIRY